MNRRRNDFDNKNYADIMQLYKLNNEMKNRIEQLERIVQFLEEKIDTIEKRNVENSLSLPEDIEEFNSCQDNLLKNDFSFVEF